MIKNKEKIYGFSLMEMLVAMLIIAVIIALSAPMITKKNGSKASSAGSLWTSFTGGNIGFNTNTAGVSSIIGGNNDDISTMGSKPPKLTLGTKNDYPHIGFVYNGKAAGTMTLKNNNSIIIGNITNATGENNIAIGSSLNISGNNTAAIGTQINNTGNNSIVIGFGINNTEPDTIILGNKDTTVVIPGTVKFKSISIGDNIKFDLDKLLNMTKGMNASTEINKLTGMQHPEFTDNIRTQSQPPEGSKMIKINGKPYYIQSDKKLKNIEDESTEGLEKITKLKIYNYTFKKDDTKSRHVGVIAQDLQKVFPDAVKKDNDGYLQIRLEDMFYAMINSIKELDKRTKEINYSAEIRELKQEVNTNKAKLAAQEEEINRLKQEIKDLKKFIKYE